MDGARNSPTTGTLATALIMLLALVIVAIWDIYSGYFDTDAGSVSTVVQDWSRRFPALPLLIGILLGHLFWPTYR